MMAIPASFVWCFAGISIVTLTNGADGIFIPIDAPVTWTYTVNNTGTAPLSDVWVTDDMLGNITFLKSGDINGDHVLDVGETWVFEKNGTAVAGILNNTGTVTSTYTDPMGSTVHPTSSDPTSYYSVQPGVQ